MQELTAKRRYNSKLFLAEDGKVVSRIHVGHIHYKNGEDFKDISWDLIFDETKRGWGFTTHSFHPFIPEYSDGWAEFRDLFHDKDQTVRYKAIVQNIIKGELIETDDTNPNFDNNIDNKGILYKDAFGKDKDYLLYHTRSSLVKVATVNNPNEQKEDVKFRWEIQFPDKNIYRAENKEAVEKVERENLFELIEDNKNKAYKLDISRTKTFDSHKDTLIGNTKLDGKEWFTYLKSFKAWDSNGNTIIVESQIIKEDGKYYLEKNIPLDFLQNAEGRVFTDTTTSYYSGAGDVRHEGYNETWSTVRNQITGQGVPTSSNTDYVQSSFASSMYFIYRLGFYFDTSSIDNSDVISGATVNFYVQTNIGPASIDIVDYTPADFDSPTRADYDQVGTTKFANTITSAGTGWKSFELNASGIANISKTGDDGFALRGQEDFNNTAPENQKYWQVRMAEYTGTTSDPYISITHAAGATSSIKSINGVAIASIKSVNGLAIASVKSVNGVAN